jgi:hypothetical protein
MEYSRSEELVRTVRSSGIITHIVEEFLDELGVCSIMIINMIFL